MRASEFITESVRVYHGNQGGIDTDKLVAPMWFTQSLEDAEMYAGDDGYVLVSDLDIKNPYVLKPTDEANHVLERWRELKQQGYDGIHDPTSDDWIPFSSEQIRVRDVIDRYEEINK
jgi:hypothetical protein